MERFLIGIDLGTKLCSSHQDWFAAAAGEAQPLQVLESLLKDGEVQQFLQVNRHQEILWSHKEAFGGSGCWP